MKAYLLFLISALLMTSCTAGDPDFIEDQQSASIEAIVKTDLYDTNNTPITTVYLKNKWEKELAAEGTPYTLGGFKVLTSTADNGSKTFFLKAISVDGSFEKGAFMTKDLSKKKEGYTLTSKTCSCKGCSSGCNLVIDGNNCRCSGCPPGQDCVKTETAVIGNQ